MTTKRPRGRNLGRAATSDALASEPSGGNVIAYETTNQMNVAPLSSSSGMNTPHVQAFGSKAPDGEAHESVDMQTNGFDANSSLAYDLIGLVDAHPKLPMGRNYIQLHLDDDGMILAAYMALLSQKTICIMPRQRTLSSSAAILKAITKMEVFYPKDGKAPSLKKTFQSFESTNSRSILLIGHNMCPYQSLKSAGPDCIIHWGLPNNIPDYAKQIPLVRPTMRSCLVLPVEQNISTLKEKQMRDYGIVQYSDEVRNSCLGTNSAFQAVRGIAVMVLDTIDPQMASNLRTFSQDFGRPTSITVVPSRAALPPVHRGRPNPNRNSMPPGHFYIILEKSTGPVELIAYLAMRSKKTICSVYWKSVKGIQGRLRGFSKLRVTIDDPNAYQQLDDEVSESGAQEYSILLRPIEICTTALEMLQPDCLICWGPPANVPLYAQECLGVVSHTYMLLTREQYDRMIKEQPNSTDYLKPHPSSGKMNAACKVNTWYKKRSRSERQRTRTGTGSSSGCVNAANKL